MKKMCVFRVVIREEVIAGLARLSQQKACRAYHNRKPAFLLADSCDN
jgi:hypothetical protein